jgi:pseudaminic acid synthase
VRAIKIAGREIGLLYPPYVVAELSGNHMGDIGRALRLIDAAAEAGVDAIKIQTFTPETMTLDINTGEFVIGDVGSIWFGRSLFDLYTESQTPWSWHQEMFNYAKNLGLTAFSTPFDATSVDFLESLDVPCYKIASAENTDLDLIRKVSSTGKPVIISTGMASLSEIDRAVKTARTSGCSELALLKCTASYPANPIESNLRTIPNTREIFSCEVGISDHTTGLGAALSSVALGGTIIEKHLTLDSSDGAIDSKFSMTPEQMKLLVAEAKAGWESIGVVHYGPTQSELDSVKYRRSLYITRDMSVGEVLSESNLQAIRPGNGLAIEYRNLALGRPLKRSVKRGTALTWDLIL